MATVETKRMTAEEFWEWASPPQNQDRHCELDQREVVELPPPGDLHGVICFQIAHLAGSALARVRPVHIPRTEGGLGYACRTVQIDRLARTLRWSRPSPLPRTGFWQKSGFLPSETPGPVALRTRFAEAIRP